VVPTANKPTTAAAMARNLSTPLIVGGAATTCVGLGAAAAVAERCATGAAEARGMVGATGAAVATAGAPAAIGADVAPVGPPGGSVGSLMVGAAEGLGGKLMRTVSFLGWTLPVSFFGGTAPLGMFGIFSAITNLSVQDSFSPERVKLLFQKHALAPADGFREKVEDPYWILDTIEFKTAWHPIGL